MNNIESVFEDKWEVTASDLTIDMVSGVGIGPTCPVDVWKHTTADTS